VLFGEGYRHDPRTPKINQDLVVFGWLETYGDIAGPFFIQKVDASQEEPGTGLQILVVHVRAWSFRVAEFKLVEPGLFTD
jgi:hypothetical protein